MEAPEVPLEDCQKSIEERSEEGGANWLSGVALSTAIFAAIAAVASLLAGQHINEAMINQIKASDQWGYYQAKGIKAGVLSAKIELLKAAGLPATPGDQQKVEKYAGDQEEISDQANEKEKESAEHLERHEKLAFAVTLFQIAIAISAIAVLTKKPHFWYLGLLFGAAGIASLILAHLHVALPRIGS